MSDNSTPPQHQRAGKYLTFRLGAEDFAIQVARVREVMGIQQITALPQAQPYVKGVVNVRGQVIPVIDLRLRFGLPELPHTTRTCIVVLQLEADACKIQIGVIVDAVSEMLTLHDSDIQDAPDYGTGAETRCLLGRVKIKNKLKSLLDIDRLWSPDDIASLGEAAK